MAWKGKLTAHYTKNVKKKDKGSGAIQVSVIKKNEKIKAPQNDDMPQTIEQRRAKFALLKINEIKKDSLVAGRFKAYSHSLPAMIQMNGLGQALAFAKQKSLGSNSDAQAWKALYLSCCEWLNKRNVWPEHDDALQGITQGSMAQYQLAHAELQAMLVWLKLFSRAEIIDSPEEEIKPLNDTESGGNNG